MRVLGKTARIPYDAYCVRSGLADAAARRIQQELAALSTLSPDGQRLLGGAVRFNAWTEAVDEDYDSVRRALELSRSGDRDGER